jgi:hypothetical protein
MNSPGVAGWIAQLVFWIVLAASAAMGELGVRSVGVFVSLWIAGLAALSYVQSPELFSPYVAVLDIVLVFVVFKGDVHLGDH